MAKILVADDNSNIQKMVGLALKDQGIDVVAVGNGEAAVRKIADVRPDLVLADVFMPVRNGYEVCQYVKTDSALAHIPVILLVGAFDPLDEQEAQRVGADGVLKKPFVPPDPLISMVKSALQRAGVTYSGAKTAEPEALRSPDLLTPSSVKMPTVDASPVGGTHEEFPTETAHGGFVEEVPARPEPLRIDSGSQPVAFGSLLETPAEEAVEEQSFVSPTHPDFVAERDWRAKDEEETEEESEEETPAASWRHEEAETHAQAEPASGSRDWRTSGFEQIAGGKSRAMGWEPEEEKRESVEAAPAASNSVAEMPAAPPAAVPETPAMPTTSSSADSWTTGGFNASKEKTTAETATAIEEVVPAASKEPTGATSPTAYMSEPMTAAPQEQQSKAPWFSTPPSPWDAEIKKASQLASTWDTPIAREVVTSPSNGAEKAAAPVSDETQAVIEQAALPAVAVEAIREEAAQVAENATQLVEQPAAGQTSFYEREESVETPAVPAAASPSMDELVAKVLSKMSPDVLQAVTREILKPVVEAMVKEELKSKKS